MHLNAYRSIYNQTKFLHESIRNNQDYNEIILYCHAKSQ